MKTFRSLASSGLLIPLLFALATLLMHLVTNAFAGYGFFRDELYYLACASNLDAGYVDQPPLSLYILAAWRAVFGDSLFSVRSLPALTGAAAVFITGMMARRLGGGRIAQAFACMGAFVSLAWIAYGTVYSMNIFDVLFWTIAIYLLMRIIQSGDAKLWLPLGIVLGLGLLNKISVLWLGFGIGAGLLLTEHRHWLKTYHPYIAAAVALVLFSPYVIWNAVHGWPHLEFIANASARKYGGLTPVDFIVGQFLTQNPPAAVLWLGGLLWLFFGRGMRPYRIFGWVYLSAFLILVINGHSKADYLAPAYGILFAAGGVATESFSVSGWRKLLRPTLAVLLATGIALFPITLPVLPVETFIAYSRALGINPPSVEGHRLEELPQFFADMFGWEEQAQAVVDAWRTLSPEEQKECAIYADNYGRCAAIDRFGRDEGLPPAIGRHNSYWMWGPRGYTGKLVIILGGDLEDKQELFESVVVAGVARSRYCMPYENNQRVFICRGLKKPLADLWPSFKVYI